MLYILYIWHVYLYHTHIHPYSLPTKTFVFTYFVELCITTHGKKFVVRAMTWWWRLNPLSSNINKMPSCCLHTPMCTHSVFYTTTKNYSKRNREQDDFVLNNTFTVHLSDHPNTLRWEKEESIFYKILCRIKILRPT